MYIRASEIIVHTQTFLSLIMPRTKGVSSVVISLQAKAEAARLAKQVLKEGKKKKNQKPSKHTANALAALSTKTNKHDKTKKQQRFVKEKVKKVKAEVTGLRPGSLDRLLRLSNFLVSGGDIRMQEKFKRASQVDMQNMLTQITTDAHLRRSENKGTSIQPKNLVNAFKSYTRIVSPELKKEFQALRKLFAMVPTYSREERALQKAERKEKLQQRKALKASQKQIE